MIKLNNIKKIGVISDTHIPTRKKFLPEKIKSNLKGCDFIIHCGDIVSESVITFLNTICPVYAVKGNMDSDDIKYPEELIFKINEKYILCIAHGGGSPFDLKNRMYKKFMSYKPDSIIFGHSHFPAYEEFAGIKFFNPGSATCGISANTIGIISFFGDEILCEIIVV